MADQPGLEIFKVYEDGKHRRYSLLFTVNGGAFAIANILIDKHTDPFVMGSLRGQHLAWGMLAFTVAMILDIYTFADKMRRFQGSDEPEIFASRGKAVLFLIGALICLGWLLGASLVRI